MMLGHKCSQQDPQYCTCTVPAGALVIQCNFCIQCDYYMYVTLYWYETNQINVVTLHYNKM